MPKARRHKRKAPVTAPAAPSDHAQQPSGSSSRPQATRTTIRRFHVLLKRQAQLRDASARGEGNAALAAAAAELADVEREIEGLGGLAAYQRMSAIGQGKDRGGGSEKVFIAWMRELGVPDGVKEGGARMRWVDTLTRALLRLLSPAPPACSKWARSSRTTTRPAKPG